MFDERLRQPGGRFRERVGPGVAEPYELQRFVTPDRFDERRAGAIRAGRDMPHERRRFERHAAAGERPDDDEPLALLKVEADPDGELGIRLKRSVEGVWHHSRKYTGST
jgi:hypothetical protein